MIARPKMSQIEWKTIKIGVFKSWDMSHPFPAQATKAFSAALLDQIGLFPDRALEAKDESRTYAHSIVDTLRPILDASRARAEANAPPTAPALRVPGGVLRLRVDGTARRDPTRPVLRLRDGAILDHMPPSMDAVLDKFVAMANVIDGADDADDDADRPPPRKRARRDSRGGER